MESTGGLAGDAKDLEVSLANMLGRILFLLLVAFVASCAPRPATPPPIRAVYLVRGHGQLSQDDRQRNPEVLVTSDFQVLEQHAQKPVAIWIDKDAVGYVRSQSPPAGKGQWFNRLPQADYPMVLVGFRDTLYSFRENLGLCCFAGPIIDWTAQVVGPGFSVIQRAQTSSLPQVRFLQGYAQVPDVESILAITNALLDGRSVPEQTATRTGVTTGSSGPITSWTDFRDDSLGFQIEYPSTWKIDAEDSWVLFYDADTEQSFNVARGNWIKRLPNDFLDHLAGTVAMTRTLTVDNRPAVLAQFEPGSALGEYDSQVAVIAPDGWGFAIGNKTKPEIFDRALASINFLNR
jgi:hypothetical protein